MEKDIVEELLNLGGSMQQCKIHQKAASEIECLRQQNAELVKVIKAARKHCDVADDGEGNVWCPNCGAEYDEPHSDDCIILLLDDAIQNNRG